MYIFCPVIYILNGVDSSYGYYRVKFIVYKRRWPLLFDEIERQTRETDG